MPSNGDDVEAGRTVMRAGGRTVLTLCVAWALAGLQIGWARAQGPLEKVPRAVVERLTGGQPQDLLVLFDDRAIETEAAALRSAAAVAHDTPAVLALKAARYAALKQDVLFGLPPGEFVLLRDFSHLPMIFY